MENFNILKVTYIYIYIIRVLYIEGGSVGAEEEPPFP